MHVDDPSELRSSLVAVEKIGPEDRRMMNADVDLRGGQETRNQLKNIRIALCGVVESRGVDENDPPPAESELIGDCDLVRA